MFAVFRFGAHISVPGIDVVALYGRFDSSLAGSLLSYLDLFSGGALKLFSIFSLGVSPYISASIMMQLLTIMVPTLEALSKEGEYGRSIINQYTRYLTLGIGLVQSIGIAAYMEHQTGFGIYSWLGFKLTTVLILSVGSLFVMWLGEQINAHGLGNGSSMIIFAGIVTALPGAIIKLWENYQMGQIGIFLVALLVAILIGVIMCIIFIERGERKIPVQYAKRVVGHKVYGGQSSYIPLKINPAGVVPVIFSNLFWVCRLQLQDFLHTDGLLFHL